MLIQFSVKNYKSFKEEQVFSMEAGTGDENIENIVTLNETNERILKTTALYGANASGKTNLISAFSAAIMMVRLSNNRQPGEKLMQMEPFAFDDKTKVEPCEFEFIFIQIIVNMYMVLKQIKIKYMKSIYISIFQQKRPEYLKEQVKNINSYSLMKEN